MGMLLENSFISPCDLTGRAPWKKKKLPSSFIFFMLLLLQYFFPLEKLLNQMAELDINTLISTFA